MLKRKLAVAMHKVNTFTTPSNASPKYIKIVAYKKKIGGNATNILFVSFPFISLISNDTKPKTIAVPVRIPFTVEGSIFTELSV
jgi:hypothetical protein